MPQENSRQLAQKIINKEKWWDILSRLIDVLRINLFIVDNNGVIILPPEEGRFGGRLLTDPSLNFDLLNNQHGSLLKNFAQNGNHLESINRFDLHSFAIPINKDSTTTIAYMIIGPLVLNKKQSEENYVSLAKEYNIASQDIINELNEIRVVSNVMIGSILNLLSEIIRDNVELSLRIQENEKTPSNSSIKEIANEVYSTVLLDELLVTFLDIALKMTNTECGSIMIADNQNQDLTIKVSRGINKDRINNTKLKMGEGIAGSAALENKMYFIDGQTSSSNRIHNLLKRPEIKQSLVMPFTSKQGLQGVLNLHTKNKNSKIEDNVDNLKYLSQLLSTAF